MVVFSRLLARASAFLAASFLIITPMLPVQMAHAQSNRPISGVVASSSGSVDISYTNEDGQQIGRSVGIGDPIYLNDEIRTGPDTSLQILLKDQTVFSLGPNGSIIFDEFIYDPTGGVEPSFSATVTKGTFKFISGKIASAKPEAMTVNLPNATASIRGTAVAGRVKEEGDSEIVLLTGAISVTPDDGGAPADIFTSGWGTSISATGIVAEPFVIPADILNDILSTVEMTAVLPQSIVARATGGGNGGGNQAQPTTLLTPEDVETIEQLVEVVTANVASDENGNINVENLAAYLVSTGLADQLGIDPSDLNDDANSNLNIEAELLSYLAAGGQPLWLTVNRDSGVDFVNPPPASYASENQNSFKYQQWASYQNTYSGLVSTSYEGSVTYSKTGLALGTGTLINSVPGGGAQTFTNSNAGSGTLDYSVVLDYDAGDITGSLDLRNMQSGSVNFDDQSVNINFTDFSAGNLQDDDLLVGLELASGSNLGSDTSDTGRFTFEGSFGSITDGTNTLDGNIASFNLEYYNESNPVYAELNAAAGVRTFIDTAGLEMTFDSNWTDNDDNTFSGTNVTYDVGQQVVVDSNNNAVDGIFSGDNSVLTYNGVTYNLVTNSEGPNYYADENDVNNQLYVYIGVEIPALKVEQYEAGTVSE